MASTDTLEKPAANIVGSKENFERKLGAAPLPEWLANLKQEAWKQYESLPMPVRTNERWRFSNINRISLEGFESAQTDISAVAADIQSRSNQVSVCAGRIVIADDQTVGEVECDPDLKAQGVIFTTLEIAFREHSELVSQYFMKESPDLGSEKFSNLHAALVTNGVFLYVPKGVEVKAPFVVYNWTVADNSAVLPHTLVVAERDSSVQIVDIFAGLRDDTRHLAVASADLYAKENAKVFYKAVQEWNEQTICMHLNTSSADRHADVKSIQVNIGASYMRHEHHTRILGEGSNIDTYSLSVPMRSQEYDQRTLQTHYAPNSRSDLLFKNALLDKSRTIFSGLIKVEENAQQTDAYQTNRNLLLDPEADANSLPGLEILANDVKCSHGATTGQLDESDLFYFLARGIPKKAAFELMVFGFFEEIIEKLTNPELEDNVRAVLEKKFARE